MGEQPPSCPGPWRPWPPPLLPVPPCLSSELPPSGSLLSRSCGPALPDVPPALCPLLFGCPRHEATARCYSLAYHLCGRPSSRQINQGTSPSTMTAPPASQLCPSSCPSTPYTSMKMPITYLRLSQEGFYGYKMKTVNTGSGKLRNLEYMPENHLQRLPVSQRENQQLLRQDLVL